ncbi:hypothetical protein HN371_22400, partial [Candidatus Poribacteria bacterium]|nr:hypothetical protein [Candidatus Poribacteria bacterium]
MPIIKRRTDDDRPANEQDLYDWVNNLPPQANVHAREASGYVGSFPAYEIQTGEPVEEYLMARYGVGTYELAGHSQGLFLAGRHTVHIGSYAERQAARRVHATQDAQEGGSMFSNLEQLVGIVKTLGLTPGNQGNQGQDELVATLMQQAVQSLRPPDPEKAMGQAFDFLKSVNEFQRSTAPPPRPRPRPKRKRKRKESAESESGVGQMLGTALFVGADLAM